MPRLKFSVPSIGSTTQSRSAVRSERFALSSDRTGMSRSAAVSRAMIAFSAAWSAAVAKFARPRLRVWILMLSVTIASPTSTAVAAARRARSA
jgi:hypothetical protein